GAGKHVVERERLVRVQGQWMVAGAVAVVDGAGPGVERVGVAEGTGVVQWLAGHGDCGSVKARDDRGRVGIKVAQGEVGSGGAARGREVHVAGGDAVGSRRYTSLAGCVERGGIAGWERGAGAGARVAKRYNAAFDWLIEGTAHCHVQRGGERSVDGSRLIVAA